MRVRLSRYGFVTAAAALSAAAWAAFLGQMHMNGRASPLDRIEAMSLDLRFQAAGPSAPPPEVTIVAIDDETMREARVFPLPRDRLAALVRRIAGHGPKALAIDLLLVADDPPGGDLKDALAAAPTLIAKAGFFGRKDAGETAIVADLGAIPVADRLLAPAAAFSEAAETGMVNLSADHAGTPRHAPLLFQHEKEGILPSFALMAAQMGSGEEPALTEGAVSFGGRTQSLDFGHHLALRYYGPRGTIRTESAGAVLRGEEDAAAFKDKIVLIGVTATGGGDTFPTPFDPELAGVEVLATAVGNLIRAEGLIRNAETRRLDALAALVLSVAMILALAMRRTTFGFILMGVATLGWSLATMAAFTDGYWLSVAVPLAAVVPSGFLCAGARLWLDRRATRRSEAFEKELRRFHSPVLAEKLTRDPSFLAEPVPVQAAIVFLDLSGYTLMSESVTPRAVHDFLKTFHAIVERETSRQRGLVINFMGDGAMLLFGFPNEAPDDARRALAALASLDRALTAWLSDLPGGEMRARFGAHFGPVLVSRLGADTHQQITATGDTVNVASRLMEIAKENRVRIAASERLCVVAGEAGVGLCSLGEAAEVPIRGRTKPLKVRLQAVEAEL